MTNDKGQMTVLEFHFHIGPARLRQALLKFRFEPVLQDRFHGTAVKSVPQTMYHISPHYFAVRADQHSQLNGAAHLRLHRAFGRRGAHRLTNGERTRGVCVTIVSNNASRPSRSVRTSLGPRVSFGSQAFERVLHGLAKRFTP